jgi:hypothetical protein
MKKKRVFQRVGKRTGKLALSVVFSTYAASRRLDSPGANGGRSSQAKGRVWSI